MVQVGYKCPKIIGTSKLANGRKWLDQMSWRWLILIGALCTNYSHKNNEWPRGHSCPLMRPIFVQGKGGRREQKQEENREKREEERKKEGQGAWFWALKSDFCKDSKNSRLVSEIMSKFMLTKCYFCMLIEARAWFKRVMT